MTRSQLDRLLEKTVADALGLKLSASARARGAAPRRIDHAISFHRDPARQLQHV